MEAAGAVMAAIIVIAGVAAVVIRSRYVVVTVLGRSMEPTYKPGQQLLVRRCRLASIRHGQVVVVASPSDWAVPAEEAAGAGGSWMIKRVVGLPGDRMDRFPSLPGTEGATIVPPGHLVLFGDNTEHSHDSRHVGFLPADGLLGVVTRLIRTE